MNENPYHNEPGYENRVGAYVYNKNNYHFDQDSGLSLRFQVTGCKQIRL